MVKSLWLGFRKFSGCVLGEIESRTRIPRCRAELCENAKDWQCAFRHRNWWDWSSPLGPKPTEWNILFLYLPPFSKKNSRITHMHSKSAFPQKQNPSLSLLFPMHLNKLMKDGTCWVPYELTPPIVMFFSRRSRRRLRRRRRSVVRVSPTPKPMPVVLGVE